MLPETKSPINPFTQSLNGILKDTDFPQNPNEAWDVAVDCVDYPVEIVPLFWKNNKTDEYETAEGVTNTGRLNQIFGINVDRDLTGKFETIGTVTGLYGTLPTAEAYRNLQGTLTEAGVESRPVRVYVSGNGGRHELVVSLGKKASPRPNIEVDMAIVFNTSVDGSKLQAIRLVAWSSEGHEILGINEADFDVNSRHTKTLGERHASNVLVVSKLVETWESDIIPMMSLMSDGEFDKETVLSLLDTLLEQSNIPDKHSVAIRSKISDEKTAFDVLNTVSGYFGELSDDKPERVDTFKKNINKNIKNVLKKFGLDAEKLK